VGLRHVEEKKDALPFDATVKAVSNCVRPEAAQSEEAVPGVIQGPAQPRPALGIPSSSRRQQHSPKAALIS
jgi:hypothetical protein